MFSMLPVLALTLKDNIGLGGAIDRLRNGTAERVTEIAIAEPEKRP